MSSKGRAGAPSESTVWGRMETLAANFRYDGVDTIKHRFGRDGGDFPNLEITTAEVKVETMEPDPAAHIIPAVKTYNCPTCEYVGVLDIDGTCANCGHNPSDDSATTTTDF